MGLVVPQHAGSAEFLQGHDLENVSIVKGVEWITYGPQHHDGYPLLVVGYGGIAARGSSSPIWPCGPGMRCGDV